MKVLFEYSLPSDARDYEIHSKAQDYRSALLMFDESLTMRIAQATEHWDAEVMLPVLREVEKEFTEALETFEVKL